MPSSVAVGLFALVLILIPNPVLAQGGRPEAPPFNAALIDMQAPPPQGVAIRAGRLFDPKSGTTVWNDSYSHDEPVAGKTIADIVEALDRNVQAGMQQLTASLGQYFLSHPRQAEAATK